MLLCEVESSSRWNRDTRGDDGVTGFWRMVVLSEKLLSKTLGWALPGRGRPELDGAPLPRTPGARAGEEFPALARDGALCWMQDPRVVVCKTGDAPLLCAARSRLRHGAPSAHASP